MKHMYTVFCYYGDYCGEPEIIVCATKEIAQREMERIYNQYREKFGEDNLDENTTFLRQSIASVTEKTGGYVDIEIVYADFVEE